MPRTPLPEDQKRKEFNCKLPAEDLTRLKKICYRRSVQGGKKYSEARFVSEAINNTPLPKPPSAKAIEEYESRNQK
jgi:hypothetical protein